MSSLKDLIKKRGSLKAKLTSFGTFLNLIKGHEILADRQKCELECRLGRINTTFDQFDALQTEIETLSEQVDEEYNERIQYEEQFYSLVATARSMLNSVVPSSPSRDGSVADDQDVNCAPKFHLPVINIPQFSGDFQEWLEFRDTYLSIIHNNHNISQIHKFHYLRAALKGSASLIIHSLDITASNYPIAWQLLTDRFDNTRLLINNHLQALFKTKNITTESSSEIRNLIDIMNKNLRALSTLGEPVEYWDTIIIYMMSKKLDSVTSRRWEEYKNNLNCTSPSLEQFSKFLNNRCDLLDILNIDIPTSSHTINKNQSNLSSNNNKNSYFKKDTVVNEKHNYQNKSNVCPMCSQNHFLFSCPSFIKLDVDARIKKATESHVCINCLRTGHNRSQCRLTNCKYCKFKHNTLLHKDKVTKEPSTSNLNFTTNILPSSNASYVILSTALVRVKDKDGHFHKARILLDNGSTCNFITEELSLKLGLVRRNITSTISSVNNHTTNATDMCELVFESCTSDYRANINCYILPKITNILPSSYINTTHLPIPQKVTLADPTFNIPSSIDILVGAEIFWAVLNSETCNIGSTRLKLHSSKLGWILSGCIYNNDRQNVCYHTSNHELDNNLSKFWELDSISSKHTYSHEEKACEDIFKNSTYRTSNGQFVVTIPLKNSADSLGDSYALAKRRFLSLENRFKKDSQFKNDYDTFIREYINLGHMSLNTPNSHMINKHNYYLPHHGVIRESSTTSKLRVVFDASAVTTSGKSFNDIQMIGPKTQDDLMSILLRFREHKYAVTGDAEKFYRSVLVHESQRSLQQIIYRFNPNEPLKTYTLNTVTYGTSSAPYLATKCLVSLANETSNLMAQRSIKHDFYVDDYLGGANSIEAAINLVKDLRNTLESANFNMRKWQSNSPVILENLNFSNDYTQKQLNLDSSPSKTLGLFWDTSCDTFYFSINNSFKQKYTKRNILSYISQVFDPLGLVGPCILQAKILLQHLWLQKCDWDEEVPSEIKHQFINLTNCLFQLNSIHIPRWTLQDNPKEVQLHIFSDASERGYGACVYVRTISTRGLIHVCLLTSKNKVAPIKPTTIPRLELCGALLSARLYKKVVNSLTIKFNDSYFWCDSTIVLGWLSTESSGLKQFVRNRVNEIKETTIGMKWSYVQSKLNPADLASRGVNAEYLSASALWWSGPDFLHSSELCIPSNPNLKNVLLPELTHHVDDNSSSHNENLMHILIHQSSNFKKLIRVFAYINRFIYNCKNKSNKLKYSLSSSELQTSLQRLLGYSQQEMFPGEYLLLMASKPISKSSRLRSLTPFIDSDNLIRAGGRLKNSFYTYDIKHPIIICSKHHLTKIIFECKHKELFHGGAQLILSNIRNQFWPLGGRNLAKAIVHACIRCTRFNAKPIQPIMGNLPTERTYLEFPFLNTGVDYAGPILIADRKGRGCKLHKAYICVFVCFAVKAVHLELVSDLSKEAFLAAFNRFISRRGKPQNMYSDNGTSFVGACNELKRFLKFNNAHIEANLAELNIKFNFIPPYTPHFGGIWEAAVKSVKTLLRRVLNLTHLVYEELSTCLYQIEAILNSRPLTPLSTEPTDLTFLTPAHFLIGRPLLSVPYPPLEHAHIDRLQRFQRIEKLRQHFWSRYSQEYIHELQKKQRWHASSGKLNIGDMVLIKESNVPPLLWLLGRITRIMKGSDGVVRVAEVQTKKGAVIRSFNNLCPLPVHQL